jgi:CheY-like chemotaxis protein
MSRLLLIDDDPAGLDLRRLVLERLGHEVLCARSVQQAADAFAQSSPKTVVMDLRLPDAADGLSLIRRFRSNVPDVRIVVLCGHPPDIENAPEAALVNRILAKPVRTETLIAAITE